MKKITLFAFIICASPLLGYAQTFSSADPVYIENVEKGFAAMKTQQYDSCVHYYSNAFEVKQTSFLSTMRMAACAYSSGDSVLYTVQIKRAFALDWGGAKQVFDEGDEFDYLRATSFERQVEQLWEESARSSGLNLSLIRELDEMRRKDQKTRGLIVEYSQIYGWDSPKVDSLWAIQTPIDKANTQRIVEIISEHGYPGKSLVGAALSGTAFLVIQHADLSVQEKYLDLITAAADMGEVSWSSVALLVDRVRMRRGENQLYGSQVRRDNDTGESYFAPIENPFKIDSIRATVGLGPIQEYADNWDIQWDPQKHLERSMEK